MATPFAKNPERTALAFRGYNITNLGRSGELLESDAYCSIFSEELKKFSAICSESTGEAVDLEDRVRSNSEPGLESYSESIAVIVAVEVAQIRALREVHGVDTSRVGLSFGYSLGELVAVSCSGVFAVEDMIRVPLAMATDSIELSKDITMGVLFSRGPVISEANVDRLCLQITSEGSGTIGISSMLSPNTYLLLGQRDTVQRFRDVMGELLPHRAHLRVNDHHWPPLHTPIVRQKYIPDRASVMMESLPGGISPSCPPVISLVTGKKSYDDHSAREILRRWIDHPQRLWDAVDHCLDQRMETVVHVGPEPNLIPATFRRLSENVQEQTKKTTLGGMGMRAVSRLARRPWLTSLLPSRAILLRAPYVNHVILEDWLLENEPS